MSEVVVDETQPEPEVPFEEPAPATEPEPEQPTEPEQPEQPPSPEAPVPPAPAGMSIEELEKVRKKLDQSATTWRNRVSDLLGEEAQLLVPCELCDPLIPGFHWPVEVEQPRDQLHAALLDVLRSPQGPDFLEDPYTRECTTCGGYGKTRTKGHVPGKTERVCPTCKGVGFQALDGTPTSPQNGDTSEVVYDLPNEEPLVSDNTDVWGSPKILPDGMENPNYGKMPQYKNPALP